MTGGNQGYRGRGRQPRLAGWLPVLRLTVAIVLIVAAGLVAPTEARRSMRKPQPTPAVPLGKITVLGDRPAPFALEARAAMLVDDTTGAVLYAFNQNSRIQPASLAKIMTFYLTLDALSVRRLTLDTKVTVSEKVWRLSMDRSVSRMFLPLGSRVRIEDLLYGLMVSSGNDAAVALAEHLAGSSEAFAQRMNARARELKMADTHFTNPDGLPEPGAYTTAADMVRLARALIRDHPEALKYTARREFTFNKIKQRNFNTLLFHDTRVTGIKTGHVKEAGYHLVVSARAHGMELIGALMGTRNALRRRLQAEKLIDWAFRTYVTAKPEWRKVLPARIRVYGGTQDEAQIAPAREPYLTVRRGEESRLEIIYKPESPYLVAPVRKGAPVGTMVVTIGKKPMLEVGVVTRSKVDRGGILKRAIDRLRRLF